MRSITDGYCWRQIDFLRNQFLQDGEFPFGDVLSEETLASALATIGSAWVDRIYSPLVTLWVFLGQVLSADHSCRAAVARLIAHRAANEQSACSAETSAYCQARKRLPEAFFAEAVRETGRALQSRIASDWLWKGRPVYLFDGSTVSMPDTPENQAAYPQHHSQRPGLGFPLARIAVVFSLACGAVMEMGACRYAGKGQGELSLLRRMWAMFTPGDVVLGDRLLCSWREMAELKLRGVDTVTRLCRRKTDFRRGKRLGKDDHLVERPKPTKPRAANLQEYKALPESLLMREIRLRVGQAGFRSRTIIVVTTLLDEEISRDELAELYRARWNNEVDLRSLKQTMHLEILRCKTPELVRKEIWTHLLAYNLIRTVMAQAAVKHGLPPRSISFQGAVRTLEAFQPMIACYPDRRRRFYGRLLDAIAAHRVADRPDRVEPRLLKRRHKHYAFLRKPRGEYQSDYTTTI